MIHAKQSQLDKLLALVVVLNLFDLLLTFVWYRAYGPAVELNPLMGYFMEINPVYALTFKAIAVISFVIPIHYGARYNYRLAYVGTWLVAFLYGALLCWHMLGPLLLYT